MRNNPFPPGLLERLLDDEPRVQTEEWNKYHFDARTMRAVVQRSIAELLNTTNIEGSLDATRHNEVMASTLNYGISPLIGGYASSRNWNSLEIKVRNALIRFEPRLIPDSIVINCSGNRQSPSSNGIINFEIHALINWHPHPIDLALKALYDVETDRANLL